MERVLVWWSIRSLDVQVCIFWNENGDLVYRTESGGKGKMSFGSSFGKFWPSPWVHSRHTFRRVCRDIYGTTWGAVRFLMCIQVSDLLFFFFFFVVKMFKGLLTGKSDTFWHYFRPYVLHRIQFSGVPEVGLREETTGSIGCQFETTL